jgi:hypothetical protein
MHFSRYQVLCSLVMDKLLTYTRRSRFLDSLTKYEPAGKREPGCSLKRLLDCCIENDTSHKAQDQDLESLKLLLLLQVVMITMIMT